MYSCECELDALRSNIRHTLTAPLHFYMRMQCIKGSSFLHFLRGSFNFIPKFIIYLDILLAKKSVLFLFEREGSLQSNDNILWPLKFLISVFQTHLTLCALTPCFSPLSCVKSTHAECLLCILMLPQAIFYILSHFQIFCS